MNLFLLHMGLPVRWQALKEGRTANFFFSLLTNLLFIYLFIYFLRTSNLREEPFPTRYMCWPRPGAGGDMKCHSPRSPAGGAARTRGVLQGALLGQGSPLGFPAVDCVYCLPESLGSPPTLMVDVDIQQTDLKRPPQDSLGT